METSLAQVFERLVTLEKVVGVSSSSGPAQEACLLSRVDVLAESLRNCVSVEHGEGLEEAMQHTEVELASLKRALEGKASLSHFHEFARDVTALQRQVSHLRDDRCEDQRTSATHYRPDEFRKMRDALCILHENITGVDMDNLLQMERIEQDIAEVKAETAQTLRKLLQARGHAGGELSRLSLPARSGAHQEATPSAIPEAGWQQAAAPFLAAKGSGKEDQARESEVTSNKLNIDELPELTGIGSQARRSEGFESPDVGSDRCSVGSALSDPSPACIGDKSDQRMRSDGRANSRLAGHDVRGW
eukprot:TRINITY_DN32351_c0_g1_i1.p1 TRINITY_DN32351_c0_g1~~TRINITY_DN32351_c0_g1_i1.p1  ORF type:complete len:303 (-),score=46.03 TRINITY_DN32351_c0_g1_i1:231-1139(-)